MRSLSVSTIDRLFEAVETLDTDDILAKAKSVLNEYSDARQNARRIVSMYEIIGAKITTTQLNDLYDWQDCPYSDHFYPATNLDKLIAMAEVYEEERVIKIWNGITK